MKFFLALLVVIAAVPVWASPLLLSTTGHMQLEGPDDDLELQQSVVAPPTDAPPTSTPGVPLAKVRRNEWQGSLCGVVESRHAVFRHNDSWQAFWKQALTPYDSSFKKIPLVDFSKDMVVGVFMGEQPRPPFQTEIVSINIEPRDQGQTLVVRYREYERMSGVFVPPFDVQPFHLRRVPLFDGPIVFEKVSR